MKSATASSAAKSLLQSSSIVSGALETSWRHGNSEFVLGFAFEGVQQVTAVGILEKIVALTEQTTCLCAHSPAVPRLAMSTTLHFMSNIVCVCVVVVRICFRQSKFRQDVETNAGLGFVDSSVYKAVLEGVGKSE